MQEFDFQKQPGLTRRRFYAPDPASALVSIITPWYNADTYFEQTFVSVMNQTFPWFDWIIVDDGSTKGTDLLHRLADSDPRITVIRQENAGPSAARNKAIANTRTDLIVPLDADDLLDPTYLECLYWALQSDPSAAWSYADSYGFQAMEYIWNHPFSAKTLKTYNFLNYTGMIRKSAIESIGGYREEPFPYHEDWRFWLDMLSAGKHPVRVGSHLFWYRRLNDGRYSSVSGSKALTTASNRVIAKAARTVDCSVQATEYPLWNTAMPDHRPEFRRYDRISAPEHKNRRVLWLVPWMVMGGADRFNLSAMKGLRDYGYDSFVLTTRPSDNGWRQQFEDVTDELFALPDFLDPALYPAFISWFIQTREIDLVFLTASFEGYHLAPWLRQQFPTLPILDYVHMEEWYWRDGGYARLSGLIGHITEHTFVCNTVTEAVMSRHFKRNPDTVETLHIGVDAAHFAPDAVPAGTLRRELGIGPEQPIVLFIGRLHPQKRPYLMLEIAKSVLSRRPDVMFVSVGGSGSPEEALKTRAEELGIQSSVRFLGEREDVRFCYRDATLTLLCSLREGLALTAYESLSMGVPVISADVGGQRDLLDETVGALIPCMQSEGKDFDARTFPEEEITAYTDAILTHLEDPVLLRRKSRAGRERILRQFTDAALYRRLAASFARHITDKELLKKRRFAAEALSRDPDTAAEFWLAGMRFQCAEDITMRPQPDGNLLFRALRFLKREGPASFVKKSLAFVRKKVRRMLRKG